MNKLVLALAAIAMLSFGDAAARACCPKKEKRCAPKTTSSCAPKPKCIKRCVVERCVEPKKICHTECHYECPPCDEVVEGAGEAKSVKSSKRSSRRMMTEEAN